MGRGSGQNNSSNLDTKDTLFNNKALSRESVREEEKKQRVAENKGRLIKAKELREHATKIRNLKKEAAKIIRTSDVPKLFPFLDGLTLEEAQEAVGSMFIITNKSVLTRDYNPYRIKVETEESSNQAVIIEVKGNG